MEPRQKEMLSSCPHGRWTWNDQTKSLQFVSLDASDVNKEKKKKTEATHLLEHSRIYRGDYNGSRPQDQRKIGQAPLKAGQASLKDAKMGKVTIEDVKQVALTLLQESESHSIPRCFLSLLRCQELDNFLATLLLYMSCYFEKKVLEMKPKPLLAEQIEADLQAVVEASAKMDLARKQLAFHYSTLVLGLNLPQHHHMACGRSPRASQCLYSFTCYVAWVTFGRKDLGIIRAEVGRLLRSDTFNTAAKAGGMNEQGSPVSSCSMKQGDMEVKEQTPPAQSQRRLQKRPALRRMVMQRSPLMVTLLPSPQEAAPHLFGSTRPQKGLPALLCDKDTLMEQLSSQLSSFCFGILGKPRSQFSSTTLKPQGMENKGEEEELEEEVEEEEEVDQHEVERLAEELEDQEVEKGDEDKDKEEDTGKNGLDTRSSHVAENPDEHSQDNAEFSGATAEELHSDRE
ncbi:protein phosphatase 1 regulatory subunit 36 [Arapaima gigas]